MINKNDLRKAISSIAISNAKRNTIYKAFSDLDSITKEEFDSVKSDISKVVESMLTKDTVGKANGVASLDSNGSVPIEQLSNIDTTLFLIVRELPTTDIKTNKIYLVPNQDGQGNNVYVEYLYVENVWEKIGEFKAEVDITDIKTKNIYPAGTGSSSLKDPSLGAIKGNYIVSNGSLGKPAHNYDKLFVKNIYWSDRTDLFDPETHLNTGYWISVFRLFAKEGYKGRPTIYTNYRVYNELEEGSHTGIYSSENGRDIIFFTDEHDSDGDNAYFRFNFMTNCIEHSSWGESEDCIFGNGVRYNAKKKIPADFVNLSTYVKSDEIYQCIKKDYDSSKRGYNCIAIDDSAQAIGDSSIAIGNKAKAINDYTIAVGSCVQAPGDNATAIGNNAQATGNFSIAVGSDVQATGDFSIAVGSDAQVMSNNAIALGNDAQATDNGAIALGLRAKATGYFSIALGCDANTSTVSKYALGGYDKNKQVIYNLEEITYSQYGNKKYLIGLGGYDGTNITINNEAGETVLNPNIKSVQEIINEKADLVGGKLKAEQLPKLVNITTASTAEEVVTKFNALLADLKAKGYMETDTAQ